MKIRIKNIDVVIKSFFGNFKLLLFSLFFILFTNIAFAQDSIPEAKDLTEEKELKFQQFFFKALSEKSIGNYQKAIENLESCNQILTQDVSVFFEFSKNYLLLNKTLLAKEYIKRALAKEPNNIWMLKHLVKVYVRDRNFSEAIIVQEKIVAKNPKERDYLVRLFLQNRSYKKALELMNKMEQENTLSSSLKRVKNNLQNRKNFTSVSNTKTKDNSTLENKFKKNKTYAVLEKLFEKYKNNTTALLKYSSEGMTLFPAQPKVYLVNGKVLNNQKKYKKALLSLQNGIDFVIDDKMEADFYKEMAKSYKGLGNTKEEKKFIEKSRKLNR